MSHAWITKTGAKLLAIIRKLVRAREWRGERGREAEAGKDKAATQLHKDVQEMAPAQENIQRSKKGKNGNSRPQATNLPQ